jgi:hypothetical protein
MDAIRKGLEANRASLDEGIQDEEHSAQNVPLREAIESESESEKARTQNRWSMSEVAPILIQLKQWREKYWVSMTHFRWRQWRMACRKEFETCEDWIWHQSTSLFSASTMMTPPNTCSIWATTTKMDLQRLLTRREKFWKVYLGTLGGEDGMRKTRVQWTEFTWLLITSPTKNYLTNVIGIASKQDRKPKNLQEVGEAKKIGPVARTLSCGFPAWQSATFRFSCTGTLRAM